MIANVSPCASCCEHTLNSLRYADRVKELKRENRDKVDPLMLPRNGINTTKKEIKKQHSFETNTIKVKNLPVALQRQESLPVNSSEYMNKVTSLQMNRLKSAKPKPPAKLQAQLRGQGQFQGNKSPKYMVSNGGGGVQINSKTKNYEELNENIQSIQSMINVNNENGHNFETKKPFAQHSNNIMNQFQRPGNQKPQNLKPRNDVQMDEANMIDDDCDEDSQGLEQI